MNAKQREALRLIARTHPESDAVITADATFWDYEIDAAYVHWSTAHALERAGLVTFERIPGGDYDPWAIHLTDAGREAAGWDAT